MPYCPDGASPDPALTEAAVYIQAAAIGTEALEILTGIWPVAALTAVFAVMPVTKLCDLNADDPGDLPIDAIWADLTTSALPGPDLAVGTLGLWVWQKAVYALFRQHCICNTTGAKPPPGSPVTIPPNLAPYPTGPNTDPALYRIENNQSAANDALLTLYKGLQYAHSYASNTYFRSAPNLVDTFTNGPSWTMQGEGYHDLLASNGAPDGAWQDVLGVLTQLTQIPPTVARRGTLTPRLYGVGSIMWDAKQPAHSSKIITRRDSIHYETESFLAPTRFTAYRLYWRLMPGVVATGQQLYYSVLDPHFAPTMGHDGQQPFHPFTFPPNWNDPPFYPPTLARAPGAPRIFPSAAPT
jgi:hypothetical protein